MKKFLALLLAALMVISMFAACAKKPITDDNSNGSSDNNGNNGSNITDPEKISDDMTSEDGKYEIAFVTDGGPLNDNAFNQDSYAGVKLYAAANGKSYKYYVPGNGGQSTDDDRVNAFKAACENGAKIVMTTGSAQENALQVIAKLYPDVSFVYIDGEAVGDSANGGIILSNVVPIRFEVVQSGYVAGYAAVMEGYTKLGFIGGGGGYGAHYDSHSYGEGFVFGAEAAAAVKGVQVEVKYTWLHGENFSASDELQAMAADWYQNGTEVILCCGGTMIDSVIAAASAESGKVIGVDVDRSSLSPTVITSAIKGLSAAVQWVLAEFYKGPLYTGGGGYGLGAESNVVGLPTDTWSLKNWSVAEYNTLLAQIASGFVHFSPLTVQFPSDSKYVTVIPVE